MDLEASKDLLKINPKLNPLNVVQSHGGIREILRGLLVGMIFASLITYIGFIDLDTTGNSNKIKNSDSNSTTVIKPNENAADFIYRKVRVLCFVVPISKGTFEQRGHMFLATWSKRCHKFLFFVDDKVDTFKEYVVPLEDKRNNWSKLREALAYIYQHHRDDFDFILRTNDNTYVVMENLRWLLYQYEPDIPLIIGQRYLKEDYMKGVYALSKAAFIRLIDVAFTNPDICEPDSYDEDKELSKCLQNVNVVHLDGIDSDKRGMFFHERPDNFLLPKENQTTFDQWYWHKLRKGLENCCSQRLIAVQNIHATQLYYMEYFIYKVHAFGRHRMYEALPQKKSAEEILKECY